MDKQYIESVTSELLKAVPEFKKIYDEHVDEYSEVLISFLFSDLGRFFLESCAEANEILSKKISDYIEGLIVKNEKEINMTINDSFFDTLLKSETSTEQLESNLGPESYKRIVEIKNWKPSKPL